MAKVKIKKTKPYKLAYIEHVGDYKSVPYDKYFTQLYEWTKGKSVRPAYKPMGIFHDDPEKTPPEECKSEIALPIKGEAKSEGDIKIKDLPSMEVAVIKHKGSSEAYKATYKELSQWITENGYEWAGPAMEVYTKKPKTVGDEMIFRTDVQAPVKKKSQKLRVVADKEETEAKEATETQEETEEETKAEEETS